MLGKIIRTARLKRGLSYQALTNLSDIGKSTLYFWENDLRSPNAELLFCLEFALKLPAGYFAKEWRKEMKQKLRTTG